jgi:hypothetical protein
VYGQGYAPSADTNAFADANLADNSWLAVKTNTLTGGSSYFSDAQWTNYPGRFYRCRLP